MSESTYLSILQNAMNNAYAPYSNYSVSALIITDSGQQYIGCNVENASYPEGLCAEASAISAMVVAGEKKIKQIYIMSQDQTGATPCGGCRQRIREFADANTLVTLCSKDKVISSLGIADLLPNSFGPGHLL
jgi:cytidine deaminase